MFTFMKSIPPYWKPFLDMMTEMVGDAEKDKAQLTATPFEAQDSSLMRVFHDADALVRLPPNANALDVGALIDIVRLDRLR